MRRLLSISAVSLAAIIGVGFAAGSASAATARGYYATQGQCMDAAWGYAIDHPQVKVWCDKIPAYYQGEIIGYVWSVFSD
jgi:hypothetical protein